MKPQVEARQSSAVEGVHGAISTRVADKCNRVPGQELSLEEEKLHADLVREGKPRELAARGEFGVYTPRSEDRASKKIAQIRQALTWKLVGGKQRVKARLVPMGFQDPDLHEGLADTSGCVSLRSSNLQVISLSAVKK